MERLAERIEEKEGIPPARQRLVYGGKQITMEKTLEDYKVPSVSDNFGRINFTRGLLFISYWL